MLRTDLGRLRVISLVEGASYLLLLGVAMPLKYFADLPGAVHYVGWAHGLLFIALCLALLIAWLRVPLSFALSVGVFVAALLPFGPFVADRWLKEKARG
ncbi:MAG: DUF3817 domain-containing protein [Planctomycetota bacterium]